MKCPHCGERPTLRVDCDLCGGTGVVEEDAPPSSQEASQTPVPDSEVVPTGSTFDTEPQVVVVENATAELLSEEDSKWHTVAIICKDELAVVLPGRIEDMPTKQIAEMCHIVNDAYRQVFNLQEEPKEIELSKMLFLTPKLDQIIAAKKDDKAFRNDVAALNRDGAIYVRVAGVERPKQAIIRDEDDND